MQSKSLAAFILLCLTLLVSASPISQAKRSPSKLTLRPGDYYRRSPENHDLYLRDLGDYWHAHNTHEPREASPEPDPSPSDANGWEPYSAVNHVDNHRSIHDVREPYLGLGSRELYVSQIKRSPANTDPYRRTPGNHEPYRRSPGNTDPHSHDVRDPNIHDVQPKSAMERELYPGGWEANAAASETKRSPGDNDPNSIDAREPGNPEPYSTGVREPVNDDPSVHESRRGLRILK